MSTINCAPYFTCDENSYKSNEQVWREMVTTNGDGCPGLRVIAENSAGVVSSFESVRIQIEGDATAIAEQPIELLGYRLKNTSSSDVWVKAANATDASTTPGTTPVAWEQSVPANGFVWESNTGNVQHLFSTAMTVWATTVAADTGTQTAPTVDTVTVTFYWRYV